MSYPSKIAHGIMFHHFHNDARPKGQGSISQEDFEETLNFIGIRRILQPQIWLEKLRKGALNKEDMCLTFDDSLLSQFEIALPVLEKYKIKAFWFVISSVFEGGMWKNEIYRLFKIKFFHDVEDFYQLFFKRIFDSKFGKRVEKIINEKDIKEQIRLFPFYSVSDAKYRLIRDLVLGEFDYEIMMDKIIEEHGLNVRDLAKNLWMTNDNLEYLAKSGHELGLHSYSHPTVMSELTREEQFEEYKKNYDHIKKISHRAPAVMAYPTNSYNKDTTGILKRLGIICGFRSNMHPWRKDGRLNPTNLDMVREDNANIISMIKIIKDRANQRNEN